MFPLSWNARSPPLLVGVSLLGACSVPTMGWSVISVPDLRRIGALPIRGRFDYAGGGIVDLRTAIFPTPPCLIWYGLGPEGLPTGGLEVLPSPVSLTPLTETTRTTVVGVVFLMDDDSSDEEDSPPLMV